MVALFKNAHKKNVSNKLDMALLKIQCMEGLYIVSGLKNMEKKRLINEMRK